MSTCGDNTGTPLARTGSLPDDYLVDGSGWLVFPDVPKATQRKWDAQSDNLTGGHTPVGFVAWREKDRIVTLKPLTFSHWLGWAAKPVPPAGAKANPHDDTFDAAERLKTVEGYRGKSVKVEVADTEPLRQRGLMFRKSLAENEGMIFVFEEPGDHPFWMQNCTIPLDMLWLDGAARVVSVAHSVPPCRFPDCPSPCNSPECPTYSPDPGTEATYVVEVVSGFAKQHGVKKGDVLTLEGIQVRPKDASGRPTRSGY